MSEFIKQTNNEQYSVTDEQLMVDGQPELTVLEFGQASLEQTNADQTLTHAIEQEQSEEKESRLKKVGRALGRLAMSQSYMMMVSTMSTMGVLNAHDPTWWKLGIGVAAGVMAGVEAYGTIKEELNAPDKDTTPVQDTRSASFPPPPPSAPGSVASFPPPPPPPPPPKFV